QVPEVTAQGRSLAPQAISTVDISADGKFITVGTMAFSHDANVWQFAPDGTVINKRHFPPWAPLQVATLPGGQAMAVGLAYSRVTSPDPTVWLGRVDDLLSANPNDNLAEADSRDGQFARLRPGSGNWRTGWFPSSFGELFVRGPDWVFKPEKAFLDATGQRQQLDYEKRNLLPTSRAMRMVASADGKRLAFGWLSFSQTMPGLPTHTDAVSVWQVNPNERLWSAPPDAPKPPALPDPLTDFRELAKNFRVAPDALVPGSVTSAVALNQDGSRVAILEYGVWGWVRTAPAIGKWDPPIHVLNFLPKQRGRLRVFDREGHEVFREWLPADGMFEIGFGSVADEIWCWPASWFARGMAGAVWLPIDSPARTIFQIKIQSNTAEAFDFPDAVADFAFSPLKGQGLVSCWDGQIYLLDPTGAPPAGVNAGSTARLAWSADGAFAVAGTADGRLMRFGRQAALDWTKSIPVTEVPSLRPPSEVVSGLPIFQGGRIPQSEHAYVGDIWIIKSGSDAVIVDAGGLSGFSITQERLRALGIERTTHVLHTHSHGDHCGGAYLMRAAGAKIVGPKAAALSLTWLMPMLTDYGIYPPRPLDLPLAITKAGDERTFETVGLKFRALFVPGHSFDLTVYKLELGGRRIAFTGDLGFENQDILHRCWGDADKARALTGVIRDKLLAWRPDVVFTGHGVRTNGTEFIASLLQQTEESLKDTGSPAPTEPRR
ncbi:MAG TPA: MBL fold metallo-hydrolase, partial [Verrucomicrobiae bacterium]|nr:MBL fold metallo-hydrolase [Verrucomicrobiae bacterium]